MNGPAINIIGEDRCTGCFACYNACPNYAIKMELNEKGFYIPKVDNEKCVNCSICQQYCPIIQKKNKTAEVNKYPKVYAAWSTNKNIRLESSSGGVFTEIANYIIENTGAVFGAAWDKDWTLRHTVVKSKNELSKLRGSKYLQSCIGYSYNKILDLLKENIKVLFVGTPCQVAALKTFTKDKNLITIDLVCHGVPSVSFFHLYIDYLFHGEKIKSISFRDKKTGWENFSLRIETKSGKVYTKKHKFDPFFSGFLKNIYLRECCYNCPFSRIPRFGDITLGDYWGISQDLKDDKGISVVLINSEKGLGVFNKLIESKMIEAFETKIDMAIKGNPRIINGNLSIPDSRENFFKDLKKNKFIFIKKKYIKTQPNIFMYKISAIKNKILKKLNIE